MPFKTLRPEEQSNALATPSSAAARAFYSPKQSAVYTTASNSCIQTDLTRHALALLHVELERKTASTNDTVNFVSDVVLLSDVGAGSGLSTRAAQNWFSERHVAVFIVAFDISAPMLSLASQGQRRDAKGTGADFYCGNAGQTLSVRDGVLDGAIGISMLQWLQPEGLETCLSSLFRQLTAGRKTRAVFQVYPASLAYVDLMEHTALRVGFARAETFVSFPHATTAKKWFFCVEKSGPVDSADAQETAEQSELCLFARRYERRCVLQWLGKSRGGADAVRKRVEKEHVKTAWHIWRKYRRSIAHGRSAATPLPPRTMAVPTKLSRRLSFTRATAALVGHFRCSLKREQIQSHSPS